VIAWLRSCDSRHSGSESSRTALRRSSGKRQ
jgi:hypothetical protein